MGERHLHPLTQESVPQIKGILAEMLAKMEDSLKVDIAAVRTHIGQVLGRVEEAEGRLDDHDQRLEDISNQIKTLQSMNIVANKFHRNAVIANVVGSAVVIAGGITTLIGVALAPLTLEESLEYLLLWMILLTPKRNRNVCCGGSRQIHLGKISAAAAHGAKLETQGARTMRAISGVFAALFVFTDTAYVIVEGHPEKKNCTKNPKKKKKKKKFEKKKFKLS
ncbi:uncharacterized protein [Aquarana catesbeiana]|uniref:uncharacterized protein n=1 Tax=Aquarana catesbeiana TaxID=8400 RepID=UPI003CC93800